ncbi:MAG TPA: hypothetical protein VMJ34_20140 [Bryobacteraceae bacterium]|nr:hypothetical protein [Bryobacteraceae bacterium]
MLSWICPECGRENDPAFQECPFCTPGPVKPAPALQRRRERSEPPSPKPVSSTYESDYSTAPSVGIEALERQLRPAAVQPKPASLFPPLPDLPYDLDCATAPFIDPSSLRLPPLPPRAPRVEWNAREHMVPARPTAQPAPVAAPPEPVITAPEFVPMDGVEPQHALPADPAAIAAEVVTKTVEPNHAPPVEFDGLVPEVVTEDPVEHRYTPPPPPEPSHDGLFIDPSSLYLHPPQRTQAHFHEDGPTGSHTIDTAYAVMPAAEPAPAALPPFALAGKVQWEARSRMSPVPPAEYPAATPETAAIADAQPHAPVAVALEEPAPMALALAPSVEIPQAPFVFRTLALLDQCNPLPWTATAPGLAQPREIFTPDHRSVLGMESDLLHLLEGLRQSPSVALLDSGLESGPLPARLEDLEYVPTPRTLASAVDWKPAPPAARDTAVTVETAVEARKWPGRRGHLPRSESTQDLGVVLAPPAEKVFRLWVRPERKAPGNGRSAGMVSRAVIGSYSKGLHLPATLRGFHEEGLLARTPVPRSAHKHHVPSWMVSLLTALVIILLSTWVLEKSAFEHLSFTRVEASTPSSDAAQSAFPTMTKYVEVTGVRASDDGKAKSEIRYVVVNHSSSDLPPFVLTVKLHPRRGNATLASFSATLPGLAASESRELRASIARDPHSFDLPDWHDLRVEAHVSAKQ